MVPNVVKHLADFTLSGSEFHRVSLATEKDLDPIFVFNCGSEKKIRIRRLKVPLLSCRKGQRM